MTELSTDEQATVDRFGIFEPEQRERRFAAAELRAAADDFKMPRNGRNVCLRRAAELDPT
jgi:hypothetical protein